MAFIAIESVGFHQALAGKTISDGKSRNCLLKMSHGMLLCKTSAERPIVNA